MIVSGEASYHAPYDHCTARYLEQAANRLVPHQMRFVTPRSIDVYMRRLREKIENDPENPAYLKTMRGAGYMFETTK